jgi:ubiquinone/menaquinone biosynthesis C-methylase UbiE
MEKKWNALWKNKTGLTDFEEKWYKFLGGFSSKKNVLEVGCGSGRGLRVFRNNATGIDFSSKALDRAKTELAGKNVKLVKGDARKLPFKEREFDLVFSSGLLEHFKNGKREDQKILDEHIRVAKRGGTVIISVPNTFCPWYVLAKYVMSLFNKYPYPDERSYNILELKNMLKSRGVENLKSAGLQLFPPSFTGWSRIYPKFISRFFDKIETLLGPACHPFCFDIICWGEVSDQRPI